MGSQVMNQLQVVSFPLRVFYRYQFQKLKKFKVFFKKLAYTIYEQYNYRKVDFKK